MAWHFARGLLLVWLLVGGATWGWIWFSHDRDRFLETLKASRGEPYDPDAIISLSPVIEELRELKSELSQVTYTYNAAGKVIVNKAPDGHASPNRADRVMIAFAPVNRGVQLIGIFGGDGSFYEPDAKIWG